MQTPVFLQKALAQLERDERLDSVAELLKRSADVVTSRGWGEKLRGEWLGHALHPLLTDLPLGCWISAGLLDVVGGRGAQRAARRLVGLGLVLVPPTVASGMADYRTLDRPPLWRVGAVHAVGNTAVALLYLSSWTARRKNHHAKGVVLGLVGGTLAWGTGYLGGHLSFARGAGVGPRGLTGDFTRQGSDGHRGLATHGRPTAASMPGDLTVTIV
jgi:uncharacterized membrane protein